MIMIIFRVHNFEYMNNMDVFCIELSNKNGNVIINFPQTSLAISSIINRPLFNDKKWTSIDKVKRVECECLTIDHYCNINNINIINFIK